jgi:hypothetical protein
MKGVLIAAALTTFPVNAEPVIVKLQIEDVMDYDRPLPSCYWQPSGCRPQNYYEPYQRPNSQYRNFNAEPWRGRPLAPIRRPYYDNRPPPYRY